MKYLLLCCIATCAVGSPAQAGLYRLIDFGIPAGAIGAEAYAPRSGDALVSVNGVIHRRAARFSQAYDYGPTDAQIVPGFDTAINTFGRTGGVLTATYDSHDEAWELGTGAPDTRLMPTSGYASAGALDSGPYPVGYVLRSGSRGANVADPIAMDPALGEQHAAAWYYTYQGNPAVLLAQPQGVAGNSVAVATKFGDKLYAVGSYRAAAGASQAVVWSEKALPFLNSNSNVSLLNTPSGLGDAYATAVTAFGAVFGNAKTATGSAALLWQSGSVDATRLPDLPGTLGSVAKGSVGEALNRDGSTDAIIWEASSDPSGYSPQLLASHVVNASGLRLVDALGAGAFAGTAIAPDGSRHAFALQDYTPHSLVLVGNSKSAGRGLGQMSAVDVSSFSHVDQISFEGAGGTCSSGGAFALDPRLFTSSKPGSPFSGASISAVNATHVRKSALGNSSCYASVGFGRQAFNVLRSGLRLDYFGFEWSTIDDYNNIIFYDGLNGTGNRIYLSEFDHPTISGADIRSYFNLSNSANGRAPDAFIGFSFDQTENVRSIVFDSWDNTAFEFDNVTLGYNIDPTIASSGLAAVPEPSPLAALALGAALLAAARRRARG